MPGRRFDSFGSTPDAPERPADPAVRKANLRRIFPLFRPYRARLSAVCALIVFSAAIGVISPFLLREVLDVAIPEQDMQLLTALVAGMVAIPIISGAVLVYVTLLSKPIGQVLCGPFTGPGSEAMAVTFNAPTCWSPQGWAVFHFTDGDWRLALNQKGVFLAGPLAAVGADIRETTPVFRRQDTTRCNPTGGTHARIWHWDGSRFTAGPWKQVKPPPARPRAARSGYFKTPSGNIVCYHSPGPADLPVAFLGCGIRTGLKPAPPRRPCENGGYAGDRVELFATGRVRVPACAGDPGPFTGLVVGARVLGYGKTWSGGGLSCRSAFAGLTCRNRSGHGFFLSRARWRRF